MGTSLSCQKCPIQVQRTVFTFSDDLIMKVTEGVEPKQPSRDEMMRMEVDDYDLFEHIKCIDEMHTQAYGLSAEHINVVLDKLERKLQKKESVEQIGILCDLDKVQACYANAEEGNTLECYDEVVRYERCIDAKYLKALMTLLEENNKAKEAAEKAKEKTLKKKQK